MARNGSGSHSIPNTMVAGTTITASDHNENYSDISAEITNSVAADGQTTMSGAFKAAAGTVDLPGLTFGTDLDTGIYRIGANNLGISAGATKIVDVSTTGILITGTLSVSGAQTWTGQATLAAGALNSDGTVSLPAYAFTNDTDCGLYRIGANNLGIAANGAKVVDIGTAGIGITGTLTASSTVTASNGLTVSAGSVTLPAGSVAGAALNSDAFASQANMETASSNTVAVTPGTAKYSPSAAKAWAYVTYSGGTPTLAANFGIASITDAGVGVLTLVFSVEMSSTSYCVLVTGEGGGWLGYVDTKAAGAVTVKIANSSSAALGDPTAAHVVIFGDQ